MTVAISWPSGLITWVEQAMQERTGKVTLRANFQIQVLSSLFYRNKGAYLVGKIINGFNEHPFALPVLHNKDGRLVIDAMREVARGDLRGGGVKRGVIVILVARHGAKQVDLHGASTDFADCTENGSGAVVYFW